MINSKLQAFLVRGFACGVVLPAVISGLHGFAQKAPPSSAEPAVRADRGSAYYHYGLARMYEEMATTGGRQDYATQAIEEYKLALGIDPGSRKLQDGLADLYFRLGRIREAVSAAQDQVTRHPEDSEAHQLLGRVYLRSLGDMQGPQSTEMLKLAIKEYESIEKLKPNDLETHLLLGQLYGLNHDSVKAEAQFKDAQRIDSGSEEVALSIARLYTEQGDMNRAVKALTDIPEGDRTARMEFALAGIYDQLKKPKDAAKAYQRSLDLDPDNTDAKRGLANALNLAGQTAEAGKVYQDLVQGDPQDAESLIRTADIQRREGHYEEALATLKKAESLVSDNAELNYNEALTYDALGRFDEAVKILKQTIAIGEHADGKYSGPEAGNRALFLDRLALVYRAQGKTAEAVEAYQQMGRMGGEFAPRGAEGAVDALRDGHQWVAATSAAADSAKSLPKNHDVQLMYARQLADSGKLEEGIKLAEKQLNGTPDDRDVFFTLADIDVRAKRWKEASAQLDKAEALATKPEEKVFVLYYRGTVAERQKLFDQAEIEFRKALALQPDNAAVGNYLGYMLADRGVKLNEALTLLRKAVEFDPQNGAYLDSLGWTYFKLGQYALAEETLRKAVLRTNSDPAVLDHLGQAYEKTGKLKQAVVEWQRSVAAYATSLAPEADPTDVARVEHRLDVARVRLAHATPAK